MPAEERPDTEPDRQRKPARRLPPAPPAARMGLLNYLTATSMDEDYEHVSRRRGPAEPGRRRAPGRGALLVLAVFGILVATAAVETARSADVTQTGHDELVKQVNARKAQLAERQETLEELSQELQSLEGDLLSATVEGRALQTRLNRLGVVTGAVEVRGPGVRIEVDDGPADNPKAEILDVDLQKLVNGLWSAGAEAISVNGERVTNLTSVRVAGASITVNLERISPPYTVLAIGEPDTLPTRFVDTPGGQWWLDLQALYGVQFRIDTEENLTVPAEDRLELRYAATPQELR